MSSLPDREYIESELWPELRDRMDGWAEEYKEERDLGLRGEFVGLYRKARKLKTLVWDGVDGSGWREGVRTMLFEVLAHGFLMLCDWDREEGQREASAKGPIQETIEP